MSKELADKQIIDAVLAGDKNAYGLLVSKYQYKIISVVGRFLPEPADREDVAQQAFIKAYQSLQGFRGDSEFYTWLYRIAVNCAKNFVKLKNHSVSTVDVDAPEIESYLGSEKLHDTASPEDLLSSAELKAHLQKALDGLPDDLREALILCEIESLSYTEIAERMGCPIGTVRSRISRARVALDKVIAQFVD